MARIIGIGGVSESGKSALAYQLASLLEDQQVCILEMDNFVFPAEKLPSIKDQKDWDRPEAVDFDQIIAAIEEEKQTEDVIIVEGIMAFAHSPLTELYDYTVFIELSKETFLERRAQEQRWGLEPQWYWEHVWSSHLKYGQFKNAHLTLSGEEPFPIQQLAPILEFARKSQRV